jgi:formylglycine-generating enzyme required for sulfatase activity
VADEGEVRDEGLRGAERPAGSEAGGPAEPRGSRSAFLRAAEKVGVLDFPVHPIRSRRILATAALAYAIIVGACSVAWLHILSQPVKPDRPLPAAVKTHAPPQTSTSDEMLQWDIGYHRAKARERRSRRRPVYGMISIPAGTAVLGGDIVAHGGFQEDVREESVHVRAFEIDKFEVTNEQYYDFVQATGAAPLPTWGGADRPSHVLLWLPACGVTFEQAQSYAKWAGKRLPTEAEWVRAARGDTTQSCPWPGFQCMGNCMTGDGPYPVGTMEGDVSPCGVVDMGGNVSEWTVDPYTPRLPYDDLEAERLRYKTIKGGNFLKGTDHARCAARDPMRVDTAAGAVGFRCVWSADQ